MAIPNPISRLFGGSSEHPPMVPFQVVANLCAVEDHSDEELEAAAETALSILIEHGDAAAGPVVGCDFEAKSVVIEFTVEAESPENLHRKIGEALRSLEAGGPFTYHDSSTARLDREREPEMVLA